MRSKAVFDHQKTILVAGGAGGQNRRYRLPKGIKIGRSFAYTVVRPDESEVIGCVYLYPPTDDEHDVDIRMWVTHQAWEEGLDGELERAVREWVAREWPFRRPYWRDRLRPGGRPG
jgi:hypothetical protein